MKWFLRALLILFVGLLITPVAMEVAEAIWARHDIAQKRRAIAALGEAQIDALIHKAIERELYELVRTHDERADWRNTRILLDPDEPQSHKEQVNSVRLLITGDVVPPEIAALDCHEMCLDLSGHLTLFWRGPGIFCFRGMVLKRTQVSFTSMRLPQGSVIEGNVASYMGHDCP